MTQTTTRPASSNRTQVRGKVEAENPNGIRIAGEWYNWSRYPGKTQEELGATFLRTGDHVDLVVSSGKWIESIWTQAEETRQAGPTPPADRTGTNGTWRHDHDGSAPRQRSATAEAVERAEQAAAQVQRVGQLLKALTARIERLERRQLDEASYEYTDADAPPEWPNHYAIGC